MILDEFVLVFLTYSSQGYLFLQIAMPPRYFRLFPTMAYYGQPRPQHDQNFLWNVFQR